MAHAEAQQSSLSNHDTVVNTESERDSSEMGQGETTTFQEF